MRTVSTCDAEAMSLKHWEEVGEAAGGSNKSFVFRIGESVCAGSKNKVIWFFVSRAEAERMIFDIHGRS